MSYRFQKLTTIYPEFVQQFLSQNPDCKHLSYAELYNRYVNTHFGWADYYPRHLEDLGNVAQEVFTSFEVLQKAWARENGIRYDSRNWLKEILFAQVRAFRPDVLFLEDLYLFDSGFRQQLREICVKRPFIVGYRGAPTEDYAALRDVDLLLTCVPNFAEHMRRAGAEVAIVRHAFQPAILSAVGGLERDLKFTFSGNLVLREGFHTQRYALIDKLMASSPLEIWTSVEQPAPISRGKRSLLGLARRAKRILKEVGFDRELSKRQQGEADEAFQKQFRKSNRSHPWIERGYTPRLHQPVFGLANFRVLARSKVTFNNHIDGAESYAGNSRLFEATGMGACLITDLKSNLAEMFELDSEIVTYKSAGECSEKVNYLLAHENELKAIAEAGQRRTLKNHTFAHRVAQLDELICRKLG